MENHEHKWIEDPMFADGVVMMVTGSLDDLGQETRVTCECGAMDYVPRNMLNRFSILPDESTPSV